MTITTPGSAPASGEAPPSGVRVRSLGPTGGPPRRRYTDDLLATAAPALAAAATSWFAMLSWTDFAQVYGGYLRPLAWIALTVALVGAALRALRTPAPIVVGAQLLAAIAAATYAVTGDLLPLGDGWDALVAAVREANTTASTYASPIGDAVAPIDPLLILGGAAAVVGIDLVACTLRRPGLAAVPLLVVLAVPIAVLGDIMPWWIALLTGLGFASMLFLGEVDAANRWGSSVEEPRAGFGVRTGSVRVSAAAIATGTVLVALTVTSLVPLGELRLFDLGGGNGGTGSGLKVENPMTDLRRDLRRGADVPVLTVTTDDPDPSYLRIAALTVFNGEAWTAGDRDVPSDQLADGQVPGLTGVDPSVKRTPYDYSIRTDADFDSRWLPVPFPLSEVQAEGDWRYDTATMDFLASSDGLDTRNIAYTAIGDRLDLQPRGLDDARSSAGLVPTRYSELPDDLPRIVDELAQQVTANTTTDYQAAVALQQFFRTRFTYDLSVAPLAESTDGLSAFLDPAGDRRGYCEQFAAAMAVMARDIGIPARVAVGFLRPDRIAPGEYVYSSHDLHAWPELFFAGYGWVRFEPTPSVRTDNPPAWTRGVTDEPAPTEAPQPSEAPSATVPSARPDQAERPDTPTAQDGADTTSASSRLPMILSVLGGGVVVVLLLGTPAALRTRRRRRRLAGSADDLWEELRDTSTDLGHPWAATWSVRVTGDKLAARLRGTTSAGDAAVLAAIETAVDAVEHARYAPAPIGAPSATTVTAITTLVEALEEVAPRRARWRARWLAPTLLRGRARTSADDGDRLETPVG